MTINIEIYKENVDTSIINSFRIIEQPHVDNVADFLSDIDWDSPSTPSDFLDIIYDQNNNVSYLHRY